MDRGYRDDKHCIKGFNMCVLDIDNGITVAMAKLLLSKYKYILYTTKRHTKELNRFRVILPMSHTLKLNKEDYKEFMTNVYAVMPFDLDEQTKDRCRKWMTFNGDYCEHDGELLDVLPLIPRTKANNDSKSKFSRYSNLTNLERWVVDNADTMGRNNILFKYAAVCNDMQKSSDEIKELVYELNAKLPKPLPKAEVESTIIQSISNF